MRRFLTLSAIVFFSGLLSSCGVPQSDYDSLNAENEKLKKEIEELKYGADNLLAIAKGRMDKKDYAGAKKELDLLIKTHPGSKQADEAENLLVEIAQIAPEVQIVTNDTNSARMPGTVNQMKIVNDEAKGITYYFDVNTPKDKDAQSIYLYYGKKANEKPWLRFRIQYAGNDKIFIQGFAIKADNVEYGITAQNGEIKTDNTAGGNRERYDSEMTKEKFDIINAIINSKTATIRCIGKQFYDDITVTESEKQGLKNVLNAYIAAGGRIYTK